MISDLDVILVVILFLKFINFKLKKRRQQYKSESSTPQHAEEGSVSSKNTTPIALSPGFESKHSNFFNECEANKRMFNF